jgi:hypothetical protein
LYHLLYLSLPTHWWTITLKVLSARHQKRWLDPCLQC